MLLQTRRSPANSGDAPEHASIENVFAPLDGSKAAKAALPVARTMARLFCATLHVVSVRDVLVRPEKALQEVGLSREELRGTILHQLCGSPAEAIINVVQAATSALLVMCTHTRAETDQFSFGSTTEAVLRKAPSRVLLIAPEQELQDWTIRRVMLAHDGTPSADIAIAPAAETASRAGAEVTAMHVAARIAEQSQEAGSLSARYVDQAQHEWPAWAGEFLDRMLALGHPSPAVKFKLLVTGGQPGSEVAQVARESTADLVVLSWHGCWEEQRCETLKVIARRCGCPVLLVKSKASATESLRAA